MQPAASDKNGGNLHFLRRNAACVWATSCMAMALALAQHRLALLHPWSFTFIALLIATFVMALLPFFVPATWRLWRSSLRGFALAWLLTGLFPAALWVALGWYGAHQWAGRKVPDGLPGILVRISGASLADAHARCAYPHRLEGQHLVMFHDDQISDPQGDLRAMDDHLSHLEELTQLRMRDKVYWMRGSFHGHRFAMYGLAFGSSKSPIGETDRHELAHAFLNQHTRPGSDPPMLLVEGWAEAQSQDSKKLAMRLMAWRRSISGWAPHWPTMSPGEKEKFVQQMPDPAGLKQLLDAAPSSYLRELTNPFWHSHDAGAVYWFGGAFVDFFIRRYGISRFLELYFNAGSRRFEDECRRLCASDLATLERDFWQDIELTAQAHPPVQH